MKKIISILLSLLLILSIAACGKKEEEPEIIGTSGVVNPMVGYNSLDEINKEANTKLAHPGVMGVTDEKFFIYNLSDAKLAEYKFTLNGYEYTFRGGDIWDHDISGYYTSNGLAFENVNGNAVDFVYDSNAKLARWYTLDGQYVFMVKDSGEMDTKTFNGITSEMIYLSSTWMANSDISGLFDSLNGSYIDETSKRATATIKTNGNSADMEVHWANSAFDSYEWKMTLYLSEDGLLYYTDGSLIEKTDKGNSVIYENTSGYFNYSGKTLYWNGAPDSNCIDCQFVRQ